ncbi:SpaH/EbpB family LPXTG-anchored major pilin [Butyrivibrio sp. XPD2002]|uniref:SpaH/EbpB family LPXTG-anchored major pilin n=1 Tax=Butyrivibrio sp. XPD2002 TaxID=1280665 RepID=UPI0004104D9E|nr:SpaH/EbpB family LPXTG-anchored major pilin [Butyrivibrio sp. XPD2002]
MKGLKKFLTGILAGAMALTMTLSAGTAMTAKAANGTITIGNAVPGQKYNAYRVFDYVPANEAQAENGGVYKLASKFSGLTNYTYDNDGNNVAMSSFFTVGDNDILSTTGLSTEDDAKVFGKAVLAYAKAKGIENDGSAVANDDGEATIQVSEYGYYVIDSSLGSAVGIDTTTPNATIKEKNSVPELKKEVTSATNSSTVYTDKAGNNAQIGDTVEFTITADLKAGGRGYVITDKLTPGLTLIPVENSNVSFSDSVTLDFSINNDYVADDGKKGFQITFNGEPSANTTVTVTYKAVLNKDAVIAADKNINEAYLIYGNKTETTHVTTETMTYPLQIKKIAKGDTTEKVLAGAEFNVYREFDNSQVMFTKISDTEYKVDPEGSVDTIVTVADTALTISGLNAENYVLVETKAPEGYNLLESSVGEHKHAQQVTVATTSTTEAIQVEKVEDGTGLTLPSTGGIGTTIFYIIGGLLIVAAVVFFVVRRKNDAE